jgi:hypothetical protein
MAKRVKHLLEAFQQTGALPPAGGGAAAQKPGSTPSSAPPPSSTAASSSAYGAPRPTARPSSSLGSPQSSPLGSTALSKPIVSPNALTHGIVLCLGLVIGVLIGHFSGRGESSAAEKATPPIVEPRIAGSELAGTSGAPPHAAATPPVPTQAPAATSALDSQLRDKGNVYTLLAITYGNSTANRELAQSTAAYLRTQNLPASDPVLRGKTLCVLVGAAPTKAQLQALQTKLRDTLGPSGANRDFQTAYPVEIDTYIAR